MFAQHTNDGREYTSDLHEAVCNFAGPDAEDRFVVLCDVVQALIMLLPQPQQALAIERLASMLIS